MGSRCNRVPLQTRFVQRHLSSSFANQVNLVAMIWQRTFRSCKNSRRRYAVIQIYLIGWPLKKLHLIKTKTEKDSVVNAMLF